jgi:hypothetical protein
VLIVALVVSGTAAKTMAMGAWNSGSGTLKNTLLMRSGSTPVVMAVSNPMIQLVNASTGASGVTITFPTAYAFTPVVTPIIDIGDTTTTIGTIDISNITTTGFFARGLAVVSGSSTVVNYNTGFNWTAIGATN